jgi:hypothetical protein
MWFQPMCVPTTTTPLKWISPFNPNHMLWVFPLPIVITFFLDKWIFIVQFKSAKHFKILITFFKQWTSIPFQKIKVFWTILITFKPWISIIFKRYKCLSLIITFFKQWMSCHSSTPNQLNVIGNVQQHRAQIIV